MLSITGGLGGGGVLGVSGVLLQATNTKKETVAVKLSLNIFFCENTLLNVILQLHCEEN